MILFFHFICLLARYIVTNISKSLNKGKVFSDDKNEDVLSRSHSCQYPLSKSKCSKLPAYENGTLKFFPPVFIQRYETVTLILQDFALKGKIRKVVDFGCSELGFFMYLKNIEGVAEILEVDIDPEILQRFSFKAAPLTADYLMGRRKTPLHVYLLAGSVEDYDDYLLGCDAVVCIELIEHLTSEVFDQLPHNIFYRIKPKIAIFTTPNADFNVLFLNFSDMRHEDHKFEWSRREFYNWTQKILKVYPEYSVKFYGIGAGPEGTENLGCCTQMAVFQRSEEGEVLCSSTKETEGIHNYKLIKHFEYPAYIDSRTTEEKIVHEVQYHVPYLSKLDTYYNYETNESIIPLSLLKQHVSELCSDDKEFIDILNKNGMTLRRTNNSWYLIHTEEELDSSDLAYGCDDWTNEDLSEFYEKDDLSFEDIWSDEKFSLEVSENFQTARSLEDCNSNIIQKNTSINAEHQESVLVTKSETKSAPQSCNQLTWEQDSSKKLCTRNKKSAKGKVQSLNLVKSKIPRKRNENEKESPVSAWKNSCNVYKPYKKIFKSCSLDSCFENINCKPTEQESYYLNLIPGSSSSFNHVSSFSPCRSEYLINYSGSSLLSSSFDKAGDSGYPFSFSPPNEDLTPEQVELFSENDMMSRSSSTLFSEVDEIDDVDEGVDNQRGLHEVFVEDIPVENGDLANNNRDGEGNNVE